MAATNSTVGDPEVGSIYGWFFLLQIPLLIPSPNLSNKMVGNTKWGGGAGCFFFFLMSLITLMHGLNGFGNWLMDGCLLLDTWNLSFSGALSLCNMRSFTGIVSRVKGGLGVRTAGFTPQSDDVIKMTHDDYES